MLSARASQHVFLGVSPLRFAASAAATIVWSAAMSGMGTMSMPGGFIAIAAVSMAAYVPGIHSISQVIRYSSHAH